MRNASFVEGFLLFSDVLGIGAFCAILMRMFSFVGLPGVGLLIVRFFFLRVRVVSRMSQGTPAPVQPL